MRGKVALLTCLVFLSVQVFGLYVANFYQDVELPYGLEPVPEENALGFLISGIILFTLLFLSLRHFKVLLRFWFFIAIFSVMSVSLRAFVDEFSSAFVAFWLAVMRMKEGDLFLHDLTEVLLYGGLVSLLYPSFSMLHVIILLLVISAYDIISVFFTKHMMRLAKIQLKTKTFAGIFVPRSKGFAILGGGDLAFPLLFLSVVMREYGYGVVFPLALSTLSLFLLIRLGKEKKAYPAMPFLTLGLLLGFLLLQLFQYPPL